MSNKITVIETANTINRNGKGSVEFEISVLSTSKPINCLIQIETDAELEQWINLVGENEIELIPEADSDSNLKVSKKVKVQVGLPEKIPSSVYEFCIYVKSIDNPDENYDYKQVQFIVEKLEDTVKKIPAWVFKVIWACIFLFGLYISNELIGKYLFFNWELKELKENLANDNYKDADITTTRILLAKSEGALPYLKWQIFGDKKDNIGDLKLNYHKLSRIKCKDLGEINHHWESYHTSPLIQTEILKKLDSSLLQKDTKTQEKTSELYFNEINTNINQKELEKELEKIIKENAKISNLKPFGFVSQLRKYRSANFYASESNEPLDPWKILKKDIGWNDKQFLNEEFYQKNKIDDNKIILPLHWTGFWIGGKSDPQQGRDKFESLLINDEFNSFVRDHRENVKKKEIGKYYNFISCLQKEQDRSFFTRIWDTLTNQLAIGICLGILFNTIINRAIDKNPNIVKHLLRKNNRN